MADPQTLRDRDVRRAIADLLDATNEFDGVYMLSLAEVSGRCAADARAVVIEPDSLEFSDPWSDGSSDGEPNTGALTVSARLLLTLMVRDDDPDRRDNGAERLASIVSNTLNGRSLAGLTMPLFTRFHSMTWLPPEPPERRISTIFTYRRLVEPWTAFGSAE